MIRNTIIFLLFLFFISNANGQFRTKKTIGDHAVLQRNVEIPITGWGTPGEKVKVILAKKEYPGVADAAGKWSIKIPPMSAGGPYEIEIKTADNGILYKDIYFGDVWLCSGQSNMAWPLEKTHNAEEMIANSTDQLIRHFKVPLANEQQPAEELPGGEWTVLSPESAGTFTAVGYYFAKYIRETNEVPIGLLNSSWGGSRIEPWMNAEILNTKHPDYSYKAYAAKNEVDVQGQKVKLQKMFPGITEKDAGMKEGKPVWLDNEEDGKWIKINPTRKWEDQGFDGVDGVAYYRTYFEAEEELTLHLGAIDDKDMTWVNGQLVGKTEGYNEERRYVVPESILRSGLNELLIRIEDTGGGGGMYASDLETKIGNRALEHFAWEMRLGALKLNVLNNKIPNLIYNAMIHPILDFPIKGVIWYQGESNAGRVVEAYDYRFLLNSLITQWREEWQNPTLPFYYVQLANFGEAYDEPDNDAWAVIRESMTEVLDLPNTGQAVIIDIGNAKDIHPRNKKDVGYRLALPARNQVYNEDVVPGSPIYAGHEIVGNHIILDFKQVGEGLVVKDKYGYLKGFSIVGEDGNYEWAQAKLENGRVVVWNEDIDAPIAVRYAWGRNPDDANLFSKDGLPVTPFRTDKE